MATLIYNVSLNKRTKKTQVRDLSGRKNKGNINKELKCTHCGKYEGKDCRVKKYQLRPMQLMQQQASPSTVDSASMKESKKASAAFSSELDPSFVARFCALNEQTTSKEVGNRESHNPKPATLGNVPT
ncbi:hypothetical protein V1504DRAFT_479100 [Lipomyces starkeyi]